MHFLPRFTLIIVVVLGMGCVPAYVSPTEGPTATLTISMKGGQLQAANIYSRAEDCSGSQTLGIVDTNKMTYNKSFPIKAGLPLSFSMSANGHILFQGTSYTTSHCVVVITFTPEQGHFYFAKYQMADNQRSCVGELLESVAGNDSLSKVNAKHRVYVAPFTPSSSSCMPL